MTDREKLKRCPCCGGDADYRTENFGATVWVMCTECGLSTSRYDTNLIIGSKGGMEWAAMTWNRRTKQ